MTTPHVRPGTPDDAEPCGVICYEAFAGLAGAHAFPPDFPTPEAAVDVIRMILARPDVYSVVAELDGRIAGSNFLWEGDIVAGVGPITVDPAAQNGAVGRRLMADVLDRAASRGSACAGVRLVQAAYHNRSLSLYAKLGFDVREPLACIQGAPPGVAVPGRTVRAATADDRAACNDLCRRVHGHDRGGELGHAIDGGTATVVERGGAITGYATMLGFFGHAVGESNDDLAAIIANSDTIAGPGFLLPTRNSALFRWCLQHGQRVVQPMTLMSMGLYNEPQGVFLPSILY